MADWEHDVREALERGGADDLDHARTHFRREPEPYRERAGWGLLGFLQPATPWHLIGVGVLLWLLSRLGFGAPVALVALVLLTVGLLSLVLMPNGARPKRWRGRLIEIDQSWRARVYRLLYRR